MSQLNPLTDTEFSTEKLRELAENAWFLKNAATSPSAEDPKCKVFELRGIGPTPRSYSAMGTRLTSIPVLRELTFSCLVRGSRFGQNLRINAFGYDTRNKMIAEFTQLVSCDHLGWMPFECMIVLPKDVVSLGLCINNLTGQPIRVKSPCILVGEHRPESNVLRLHRTDYGIPCREREATTVVLVNYKACVRRAGNVDEGIITFPIPGPYRAQVPLTFSVSTEPIGSLVDCRIKRREDGTNWIAEVRVNPPAKEAIVSWQSLVLIRGNPEQLPPKRKAFVPSEVAPWLRSTKCVQSGDQEISAKAQELAAATDDVESYVRRVVSFTSKNRGTGQEFFGLDAKSALHCGGSCTSRANLAAALLRANGIPARTVAHLPSWFRGRFFQHWLVEYWHPDTGWVWIEPTLNRFQPAENELVVLAVSNVDDEEKSDDPVHLRYIMPGAPYLSGCELSAELHAGLTMRNIQGPNSAIEESKIAGTAQELETLFNTAHAHFMDVVATSVKNPLYAQKIRSTVRAGDARELTKLLKSSVPR